MVVGCVIRMVERGVGAESLFWEEESFRNLVAFTDSTVQINIKNTYNRPSLWWKGDTITLAMIAFHEDLL